MKEDFALSYSGGKDSVLALHRMIAAGHHPARLLTTFNKNRSWFHGIPKDLLKRAADSLNIPLQLVVCEPGEDYNLLFEAALSELKRDGISVCVFGDIDLQPHRDWCEERCRSVGIKAILPLWKEERENLVKEFLAAGFRTVVKTVRLTDLGEHFLGETLTPDLVEQIKLAGADACGENGEYHTFVVDGPLFRYPVPFTILGRKKNETHAYLDIV